MSETTIISTAAIHIPARSFDVVINEQSIDVVGVGFKQAYCEVSYNGRWTRYESALYPPNDPARREQAINYLINEL